MNRGEFKEKSELRKLAEEKLANKIKTSTKLSEIEAQQLIHELEVHQIELEMQNEELRNTQIKLEKSRARYAELYDFAPVGYFTFDKFGAIIELNLTGAQMLNVPRQVLLLKPFSSYLSKTDSDIFFFHRQNVIKSATRQNCDLQIERKEGEPLFVHLESILVENNCIRTSIHDITEFKHAEEEKKKWEAQRLRSQKIEAIGTLAGGIAHDFNNILTGLFGNLEIAKRKIQKDHEAYPYIVNANQALQRATDLTKQFLTFAKGGDPILETLNLKEIVQRTVTFNLVGSNVKPHFILSDDLWQIKADKGQISQVIANLTINAKQSMPSGGNLYINTENIDPHKINTSPHLSGDLVKLSLRDEGVGISKADLENIFHPYFSTKPTGCGFGLSIVHSIIAKHNGQINVDSTPGIGTTVTIILPAERTSQIPITTIVHDKTDNLASITGHILLMDDEVTVREVTIEMLEMIGFSVDSANDGKEAVEKYRSAYKSNEPFDVVIMDLTIPGGMGGKEAVKEILTINPEAKVIVSSGYSTDTIMANYREYGFKGRLFKPFQMEDLINELAMVMEISCD